jgi:pimeloyl-ACP methyl ester carboxylesterase
MDYPALVRTLTFLSPVSPFGFGGTKGEDGQPCFADFAGSGGGVVNPEFVQRIKDGDRSAEGPNSPRNVIAAFYYKPPFMPDREEEFLSASLLEKMGDQKYPGDMVPSNNWPNVAPGYWGPINATSPRHFNASGIAEMNPKFPILWIRGDADLIVSVNSMFDLGALGKLGFVPGWPGDEVYPPQPMVSQMRFVLEQYKDNGGSYKEYVIADAGHGCQIEKPEEFLKVFLGHIG